MDLFQEAQNWAVGQFGRIQGDATAVALNTVDPIYRVGASLNAATGGQTDAYDLRSALRLEYLEAKGLALETTRLSNFTQSASGYVTPSGVPGTGQWQMPLVNEKTPVVVGEAASGLAAGVGDILGQTLGGLFEGLTKNLGGALLIVGGVVVAAAVLKGRGGPARA